METSTIISDIDGFRQNSSRNYSNSTINLDDSDILYQVPVGVIVLLSIFYGSISIIAVIGNSLVIWIVATTRQMQTVTNLFIANLALADVVIGMFVIPFQFQAALLQRWNLPEFMCAFCPFVQTVSVNVSVFTLTAIAVDRHRAIINPLRARPPKYISKFIIAFIWVISLAFSIPMAIALHVIMQQRHEILPDKSIREIEYPFCNTDNMNAERFQKYRYYLVFVQVIKMLIIVVLLFGICWFPLQLYNILHVTWEDVNEYKYINIVWFCCDWLAMSNSCYNPFIYGIYNEKFKREFRRRFPLFRLRFDHNDISEKNVSMYTRASSIRSNYTTQSSTKTKFLIPQRIGGGNDTFQQYNALHMTDNSHNHAKNNHILNGNQSHWTMKSSWLFNHQPSTMVANGTVVEWQDKKCACFSKIYGNGNDHSSCTKTTMATATSMPLTAADHNQTCNTSKNIHSSSDSITNRMKNPKSTLLSSSSSSSSSSFTDAAGIGAMGPRDLTENCFCKRNTKFNKNRIFEHELRTMPTNNEWKQLNLPNANDCAATQFTIAEHANIPDTTNDGDAFGEDFEKSVIQINNIYNSCAANASATIGEANLLNDHEHSYSLADRCKNDIKL